MAIKEENSIGFRIVQAFGAKDLKEVSQVLGENYSSLHNWATQRRDFPTNILIKIARMTNRSIDWILTGENANVSVPDSTLSFEKLFADKVRAILLAEFENSSVIHEKIQGIVLAMQSNIKEQDAFQNTDKDEKAA